METRLMAIKFSDITGGGIPYGNNAGRPANPGVGKLYSNGEEKRLELYTSSGWQNIVSETPGVVSVSGTYNESTGGTLDITGTNFTTGAIASAIGTNGIEINASSTTVNSIVSVTAVFSGLAAIHEPYDIKVTNTSNLFGLLPDALYVNASPVWQTASGSLGTFNEQVSVSVSATATDQENTTITYSLANGSSLPSGVTLNSSTGTISGTLPNISTNTTYTFTVNATDGVNIVPRSFSISSVALPSATSIDALIVAGGGGGGGGYYAGGGGAGGVRQLSSISLASLSCTVTVGAGGNGGLFGTRGAQGQNSVLAIASGSTYSATGGGGGAGTPGLTGGESATSGGSGGGGSLYSPYMNGAAGNSGGYNPVEGYAGGTGSGYQTNTNSNGGGAGGGGAGGAGESVVGAVNRAGYGGMGITSTITGTSLKYAGGGGGAVWTGAQESGIYADYGGGRGSADNTIPGGNGVANTGGGGGGAKGDTNAGGGSGGNGGSGVIVIAYPNTYAPLSIGSGLTYNTPTRSGYWVYRFTAGSGTVTF